MQEIDRSMSDAKSETDYDRLDGRRSRYKRDNICKRLPCNSPLELCCRGQVCVCGGLWTNCHCKDSSSAITAYNYICIRICLLAFLLQIMDLPDLSVRLLFSIVKASVFTFWV
ncbi:uncharacterized protein LOC128250537 isoform X2 [Octopus bimaculoides]|uniref:uncharacterized protein LOC128250537 isoform X2 n=1 Tax=Octopus bimaculoides TaxID=37653 RepID=UPI0022E19DDA|nr:uncharacterized protein LOC128250537 isoform X2 [Octopus bimaculoides]